LGQLPTRTLAELLFALLESFDDSGELLDVQHALLLATQQLERISPAEKPPVCRASLCSKARA